MMPPRRAVQAEERSAFPRLDLTTYLGYKELAMINVVCTSSLHLTLSLIYFKNSLVAFFLKKNTWIKDKLSNLKCILLYSSEFMLLMILKPDV